MAADAAAIVTADTINQERAQYLIDLREMELGAIKQATDNSTGAYGFKKDIGRARRTPEQLRVSPDYADYLAYKRN